MPSAGVSVEQNQESPRATPGPVAADTEAVATASQPIAGTPTPTEDLPRTAPVVQGAFVTFDSTRKCLARIVAVTGRTVTIRRYAKKTGEWQTKNESREREACIPLTAAEAEEHFPGSLAAWDNAGNPPTQSGDNVTRQLSRNSVPQTITATDFQSLADFVSAYADKKKTIDDLTSKFVEKAGEAKRAQDDIIPHLGFMQSFLSKKGAHHRLVIAARKQGHKIPWWTDFFKGYKDKLWESLRTMERRIAAYRSDPTAAISKLERDTGPVPRLNKADRKALIEGNHRANELVSTLEAGRDGRAEIAGFEAVMDAKRLDDIVQAHLAEPDYRGILSRVLQTVAKMEPSLPAAFVTAVRELAKPCKFKITAAPVPTQKSSGNAGMNVRTGWRTKGTTKPLQIAPVPQKPTEYVPLRPGKKYTVRPHPQEGFGVYEPKSTVCLQKHPSHDAAWEAIDAVNAVSPSAPQVNSSDNRSAVEGTPA